MPDDHVQKTLSELLAQREKKAAEFAAELKRMDATIEGIRMAFQPDTNASPAGTSSTETYKASDSVAASGLGAIQAGDFFGKPQADAAQEYLKRLGRASTIEDIYNALQRGGAKLQGKDPKKNLYISLVKRKAVFVLVAPYTFGLWEFYPNAKQSAGGQERISAQVEEVMQDGKTHRVVEVLKGLQERFGENVSRATVTNILLRGDRYRKVKRGQFKLKKEAAT